MESTDRPKPEPPDSSAAPNGIHWERWGLCVILGAFMLVGLNHIRTNAHYGQDFLLHSTSTETLMAHPEQWFPQDFTNRPLVYWVGAFSHWLTRGVGAWETAAGIFVVLNTLALWLLHRTARRFIASPWLRLSAVAFAAFLPATQVGIIVYAADAVCQLPFVLIVWSLLGCFEAKTSPSRLGYAALAGLALCLGGFARFTFILLIPTAAVAIALCVRWRRATWRQGLAIAALTLVAPTLLAGWIHFRAKRLLADKAPHHTFNWHGTGDMTWSSLLLVKVSDRRIFDAPVYWDSQIIEGQPRYVLLINNSYSYPALLHLSVFTDVLDYANEGQIDDGAIRPEPQRTLARWSVRLGLIFSIATLFAVLRFSFRTVGGVWRPTLAPSSGLLLWGLMALGWYVPLAAILPFVNNSYDWGYWLSRLIIPALWGFSLVLFATVDELLPTRRWPSVLIAGLVAAQALLHIRSLWY